MTASGPGGDAPQGPDGTPTVPEYVWRLFLEDDERAIRASAPREPAARDRLPGRPPEPSAGRPGEALAPAPVPTVGEAWRAEDTWAGPAWRELDGRARARRIGRVLGTAAAAALALTAWSHLSTDPVVPDGGPAETIGQRLEESPALPTAGSLPDAAVPTPSGDASPAVFEPAPSATPGASGSPWTIN
ncbi:hypothetical protein ACWEFD_00535 [Streptomyces ardesiacus]